MSHRRKAVISTKRDRVDEEGVIDGSVGPLSPQKSQIIRVFISSTFSDTCSERNILMEKAYPKLKEYCRHYDLEFQAYDLRWGIRDVSHDDHSIVDFCLREIEKCNQLSAGPSIVALLGQKYGYRPYPSCIRADEFEMLLAELKLIFTESNKDRLVIYTSNINNNNKPAINCNNNDNKASKRLNRNNHIAKDLLNNLIPITSFIPTLNTDSDLVVTQEDIDILEFWYRKDENVVPNVYRMRSISSVLPDVNSENAELKQSATDKWYETSKRIIHLWRLSADACFKKGIMNESNRNGYFISVTEMELDYGILRNTNPNNTTLCFFRHIKDLSTKHLKHPTTAKYLDVKEVGDEIIVDEEAQNLLRILKDEKINVTINHEDNKEIFVVEWSDETQDPNASQDYLELFCNSFVSKMKLLIDKSLNFFQVLTYDEILQDIVHHVYSAQQKCKECRGREFFQDKIRDMIRLVQNNSENSRSNITSSGRPVVLYGESGCGKSVLMAKLFSMVHPWFEGEGSVVKPISLVRFLGTTALSCDIRLILGSLCWQISRAYDLNVSNIPGEYVKLVVHFGNLLKLATADRPLILLLDSLDQLSTNHRAHNLAWLPHTLPPYVSIILTTLPLSYDILTTLKKLIGVQENFIEVTSLGSNLSINIVMKYLNDCKRSLTEGQLEIVEKSFKTCTFPLYTALVSKEVGRWASYDNPEPLASTCEDIIHNLFSRIEDYYGTILVKHFFSYISASKNGLSGAELEDVLSLDDVVLNDVFQHWVPPMRRIPPLLLHRIKDEMSNYIVEREANGISVIYWYHNKFLQVSKKRYLSNPIFFRYIHTLLAHYFLGTWSGGKKKLLDAAPPPPSAITVPRLNQKRKFDRMVAKQPLCYDKAGQNSLFRRYNLRKLAELPHHLVQSGMFSQFRTHVLFNYEWLHAKMAATSVHEILADCSEACDTNSIFRNDVELQLVVTALRVGGTHLTQCPDSLAFDLLGRLLVYYDEYKKLNTVQKYKSQDNLNINDDDALVLETANDKVKIDYKAVLNLQHEFLESSKETNKRRQKTFRPNDLLHLLQQCDNRSLKHSALIPVHQCFEHPDTMLMYILDGHSARPTDAIFSIITNEFISISGKELLCWDLTCGGVSRKIHLPELRSNWNDTLSNHTAVNQLFLNRNGTKLVVASKNAGFPALVYDVKSGILERTCGSKQANSSRTFLAGDVFCQQNLFLDINNGEQLADITDFAKGKNINTVAMSKDGSLLLISEDHFVKVFDFKTKQQLCQLQGKTPPNIISMGRNNTIVFVGYSDGGLLNMFELNKTCKNSQIKSSFTFNFAKSFPHDEVEKHKGVILCEITDIVLPPTSNFNNITVDEINRKVLLNINNISLCVVDTVRGTYVLMSMEFLNTPTCNSPVNIPATPITSTKSPQEIMLLKTFNSPQHQGYENLKLPLDKKIQRPAFSGNGEYVLAGVGNRLCIWERATGINLRSLNLHSHAGFVLTTAEKHYVVTTSTLNSAMRVWDLKEVKQVIHCETNLVTNCGPIRKLCCAKNAKLAFVENSFSSSTAIGMKQPDYFGLDVVDLVDGTRKTLLEYGKYGRLLQLQVTQDGQILTLLLSFVNHNHYVVILDVINTGNIIAVMEHDHCRSFETSPDWRWLASESFNESTSEIKLWKINVNDSQSKSLKTNKKDQFSKNITLTEEASFKDKKCPTFLLDSKRFAFISSKGKTVKIYSLETLDLLIEIGSGSYESLKTIPTKRDLLVAVERDSEREFINNTLLNLTSDVSIENVKFTSEKELADISKDGKFAVDSNLNVYNLNEKGRKMMTFKEEKDVDEQATCCKSKPDEIRNVTFTYDGQFVIWTEGNELKAAQLSNGNKIGNAYLHETARCLDVVEAGYVQVVGGGNGHLFIVRLVADESDNAEIGGSYNPNNFKERLHYFLDRQANFKSSGNDEIWNQIDPMYGGNMSLNDNKAPEELNATEIDVSSLDNTPIGRTNERRQLVDSASDRHFQFKITDDAIKFLKSKADVPITSLSGLKKPQNSSEFQMNDNNKLQPKYKTIGFEKRAKSPLKLKLTSVENSPDSNVQNISPRKKSPNAAVKKYATVNALVKNTLMSNTKR